MATCSLIWICHPQETITSSVAFLCSQEHFSISLLFWQHFLATEDSPHVATPGLLWQALFKQIVKTSHMQLQFIKKVALQTLLCWLLTCGPLLCCCSTFLQTCASVPLCWNSLCRCGPFRRCWLRVDRTVKGWVMLNPKRNTDTHAEHHRQSMPPLFTGHLHNHCSQLNWMVSTCSVTMKVSE